MSYELELLDCNCNECIHMERDFVKYKKWEEYWRNYDLVLFEKQKQEAIRIANLDPTEKGRQTLLSKANKMQFEFDKSHLTNYGRCKKFCKDISFRQGNFQLETQQCFSHRRAIKFENI